MTESKTNFLNNKLNCKPFLRWAGGKRWLLKGLDKYLPQDGFDQYHEPFIGGGAVFFHLLSDKNSFISDLNCELIEVYNSLQNEVEEVITELLKFKNTKEDYYKIRKSNYRSSYKRAARFIYLNQTSFNGIYRVNLKGEYNVPYGYRDNFKFDIDNIRSVSQALKQTEINVNDFGSVTENVRPNDLVFIDPPYTVAHNNNGFIQYNQKIFSLEDQYRLSNTINEIKEIGAYYILTNAAHTKIKEIFNNDDKLFEVKRSSIIGGKNAKRGKFSELIITNAI